MQCVGVDEYYWRLENFKEKLLMTLNKKDSHQSVSAILTILIEIKEP